MTRTAFDVIAEDIIDPRCDECGRGIPRKSMPGLPELCWDCDRKREIEWQARLAEYRRAERPDRRVHVVKLPPGFK